MDTLSSSDFRNFDPVLRDAMEEGSKTGSMTPIIKQELKYTILARRHNSGQGEIDLEDEKPKGKRELTTEERRKKERRKEQNRRAAARCREKKKKMSEMVLQEFINEQGEKRRLEKEVADLKKEKAELRRLLDEHAFMCRRTFTPTPNVTPSYDDQTTFKFPACTVPSPYQTETEFPRDNVTPSMSNDVMDDVFSNGELSKCMYPSVLGDPIVNQPPPLPSEFDLEEMIFPDDYHQFQLQCIQQPELEQLNGGRGSISDYLDPSLAH